MTNKYTLVGTNVEGCVKASREQGARVSPIVKSAAWLEEVEDWSKLRITAEERGEEHSECKTNACSRNQGRM